MNLEVCAQLHLPMLLMQCFAFFGNLEKTKSSAHLIVLEFLRQPCATEILHYVTTNLIFHEEKTETLS
jgi:hypothetical protein